MRYSGRFLDIIDKFGADKLNLFLKEINLYDGKYKNLTNPEVFALRRAASLNEARERILAARQTGMSSVSAKTSQKSQTSGITSPNSKPVSTAKNGGKKTLPGYDYDLR